MRILGLDYGTVRIGVAISDQMGIIAQPRGFIKATPHKECLAEIGRICSEYEIQKIIIGLPLHMSGDEGESALSAKNLGNAIIEHTQLPVVYMDERLSTISAEKILRDKNIRGEKKKQKIDSIAAAIILQNYLDKQAGV